MNQPTQAPPHPHAPAPAPYLPPPHVPAHIGHPAPHAPQAYPQAPGGHPGFAPVPGHPHFAPGYPQPINIVVQNTNTMTQHAGAGHLARVANRNKWVAAGLAFLFGWIGVHKFYLGQFGMGVVYLLLSWTAIPLFISLIETIMLVVASEREFDVRFNSRLAR